MRQSCARASRSSSQPGWKTYWRYPGDSGVPPRFDFAGSDNVETVTVLWPAPQRFADGAGGNSIGYTDDVIFPLRIVPQDRGKPVTLRAEARLCGLREALRAGRGARRTRADRRVRRAQDAALAAAMRRVPKPAAIGDGAPWRSARFAARTRRQARVIVDVAAPDGAERRICSPKARRRTGRCRCRSRSTARRPGRSASPSSSTELPPGAKRRRRGAQLTAGRRRRRDRGHDPSRLIRQPR